MLWVRKLYIVNDCSLNGSSATSFVVCPISVTLPLRTRTTLCFRGKNSLPGLGRKHSFVVLHLMDPSFAMTCTIPRSMSPSTSLLIAAYPRPISPIPSPSCAFPSWPCGHSLRACQIILGPNSFVSDDELLLDGSEEEDRDCITPGYHTVDVAYQATLNAKMAGRHFKAEAAPAMAATVSAAKKRKGRGPACKSRNSSKSSISAKSTA